MNMILDVAVVAILLFFISTSMKKGGVRAIIELLSFVITVFAVMIFKDTVSEFILKLEPVAKWVESLSNYFIEKYTALPAVADIYILPQDMAPTLVSFIVNVLSFIVTYFIVKFVLKAVLEISDVITSLPFIKSANRLIGGVIGGAKGLIIIWLVMAAMLLLVTTDLYSVYNAALSESTIAKFLYNNNLFFNLFK